ncbi:bifunctional DNA-formamidopyrimidine glycosylase/DNA-(apurinic or apyrimidinic site) lyase [Martelella alba]|uniref:Formamidopyrimidine-DNA glycosylase n=1 Tax=Martelella alba TaxID=2590451 RepID=A0A506U0G4_9HYPH|nr:bifunctional DNA-formamidopyrimidine glycosylase/DNA-(apurinic or apyrimidinic site) lyase [Martelella alba]TPW27822.1 bifunctional DNA-formamidopyrimidine glycosylase/DNA-(apurinic or apyrimidinic site) lyase [Martelella alba]
MPELPEVETVRRGLAPAMENTVIERLELKREDLRFAFPQGFAAVTEGRRIESLGRRAKYLLIDLDDGMTIIAHLGMSGSFRIETGEKNDTPGAFALPRGKDEKHDHVIFHLTGPGGPLRVIYNDPRRFGFMLLSARRDLETLSAFRNLGPEPVGNALDAAALATRFAGKKQPLKTALLDQRNIAGLGNIYVCEALWHARLSPFTLAGNLVSPTGRPRASLERLVEAIRTVIAEAIAAGGSTLRDHRQADGTLGYFQHNFAVYDRTGEPCRHEGCTGTIARAVQGGRSTFYCATCQKG